MSISDPIISTNEQRIKMSTRKEERDGCVGNSTLNQPSLFHWQPKGYLKEELRTQQVASTSQTQVVIYYIVLKEIDEQDRAYINCMNTPFRINIQYIVIQSGKLNLDFQW